jgi:Domain of unknown function (DUF4189)
MENGGFVLGEGGDQVSMGYLKLGSDPLRRSLCATVASLALLAALPTAAEAHWGAIAVDQATGATGVSYGYRTVSGASHRARRECKKSDCRTAVSVFNGYAALILKRSGAFVTGVGKTRGLAFNRARERAHEKSARPIAWVFSG